MDGADAGVSDPEPVLTPLVVSEPRPLAAVAGRYGPNRSALQFYSGDLGWTFRDHDRLWIMFGDSWVDPLIRTIDVASNQPADDGIGYVSLTDYPDGATVEQFIRAHPAAPGAFPWQADPPNITLAVNSGSGVATPLRQVRDGMSLSSGAGLTPLVGFSNQRSDQSAGVFGIFLRNAPVECAAGMCAGGLSCDAGLGVCVKSGQKRDDLSIPCVLGSASTSDCEQCQPVAGNGLCVDTQSSLYDPDVARGRSGSVAMTQEVGNMVRGSDHLFATQAWNTQRFFNLTARTVRDFDAARAKGKGDDYRAADGGNPEREGVFLFGRPHFGGIHKQHRDAELYLAWVPMPSYAQDGHFAWNPRFYAGQDADGKPRFVEREFDSVPLDLDAAQSGNQPEEPIDVVGHTTVAYLASIERWIMLYGGNLQTLYAGLIYGEDAPLIDTTTLGPVYVRYAVHPWGPWTAPEPFARPGDPTALTGLYAPGSILRSTTCSASDCVSPEITLTNENGWLYAPHIIEPWVQPRDGGMIDIYWHVSTWNPYQLILMKSTVQAP
jgi:hypothetical protein